MQKSKSQSRLERQSQTQIDDLKDSWAKIILYDKK